MDKRHERMATWWIHWPDLNWPDSDNLDKIKARAEGFAEAGVSAAMLFGAHFRWDFLPVFPLLHDYIATVAQELHKYGIKLFDHHSVNLAHRYSTREEMRHVMLDSGPHLPFSPSLEAAKSWQYKGKYLNDWRMVDVRTREPLWFPQYTAQGFCHRNPEFREAYQDYAKYLVSDTGIDGLSADDAMYFMHYNACGCKYCREELKNRAGIHLPPVEDASFWGNWDNPAWHHWLDLRFDAAGEFYQQLRAVLPEDFMLTGCGANSASATALMSATDARTFLRGWNYVNMEMSGNTPPYKQDKLTANIPIPERLVNASHHQAAARGRNAGAFCTGFAHSAPQSNVVWAVSKMLGADAWIGTLKTRLGLPRHILDTLPGEEDIVGEAFNFEKDHAQLFSGELVGQLGVYFSYETRNHTLYGGLHHGYFRDYKDILSLLFKSGINPHTVFSFPENPETYPLILLAGVSRMTEEELAEMERYMSAGGNVMVLGPTPIAGCRHSWQLPNRVDVSPEEFFTSVPDGIHTKKPAWFTDTQIPPTKDAPVWQQPRENLLYHPARPGDIDEQELVKTVKKFLRPLPVTVSEAKGYLTTLLRDDKGLTLQLVAADYDVDINHELDAMRFHRSRVNLLTHIAPTGVDGSILLETDLVPEVYTPFNKETSRVTQEGGQCRITLPEGCSYALLRFATKK